MLSKFVAEVACRGPKPKQDESEEEGVTIGPKLPDQVSDLSKRQNLKHHYLFCIRIILLDVIKPFFSSISNSFDR